MVRHRNWTTPVLIGAGVGAATTGIAAPRIMEHETGYGGGAVAARWRYTPIPALPRADGSMRVGRDQIAALIISKYKGHGMARLVEAVLETQGYTTFRSPEGPDNGVDILAAPGPLGFEQPRICVQVKSSDSPVDLPTLHQLLGSMQNVGASQGLLVSWGGFKSSIDKQIASHFFRVRLWDQDALIDEILAHYDDLDEELRAELPLTGIWTESRAQAARNRSTPRPAT